VFWDKNEGFSSGVGFVFLLFLPKNFLAKASLNLRAPFLPGRGGKYQPRASASS